MKSIEDLRDWAKHYNSTGCRDILMFADAIEAELAERYIALPVDAECEPIHVGDVMEWCDPDGEVTVTCEVDAVGVECFFAWDGANGRYAQKCANAYRHHHAPTVEDVLREFANECLTYATCVDDHEVADAIELYAKRLRLAGEE